MNDVAKNIRRLRKRDGLPQEALAEKLNVTRQAVSSWETGKTQPDIDMLISIASVFSVDVAEVIYGEKKQVTQPPRSKKRLIAVAVSGAFAVACIPVQLFLVPHWKYMSSRYFNPIPLLTFKFLVNPLFYVDIAILFFGLFSLWKDIRIKQMKIRRSLLAAGFVIIVFYYAVALNSFLGLSPFLGFFVFSFMLPLTTNPALFLIPGSLLFFGFNKNR